MSFPRFNIALPSNHVVGVMVTPKDSSFNSSSYVKPSMSPTTLRNEVGYLGGLTCLSRGSCQDTAKNPKLKPAKAVSSKIRFIQSESNVLTLTTLDLHDVNKFEPSAYKRCDFKARLNKAFNNVSLSCRDIKGSGM